MGLFPVDSSGMIKEKIDKFVGSYMALMTANSQEDFDSNLAASDLSREGRLRSGRTGPEQEAAFVGSQRGLWEPYCELLR